MHPSSLYPLRGVIVLRLANALRQLGHSVEVFELGAKGGVPRYLRARPEVARTLKRIDADVLHVHFGYSGLAIPDWRLPIITSFYGDDLNGTVGVHERVTARSRVGIAVSQYVAWRSKRCIAV